MCILISGWRQMLAKIFMLILAGKKMVPFKLYLLFFEPEE